jgi:hypothetical protein
VFEAIDQRTNKKVALKRVEKVGTQLSREFEILLDVKDSDHVVKILVFFLNLYLLGYFLFKKIRWCQIDLKYCL